MSQTRQDARMGVAVDACMDKGRLVMVEEELPLAFMTSDVGWVVVHRGT